MESERLLHPVINQDGVDTQNEVVKEEKRLRVDNSPYGKFLEMIKVNMFKKDQQLETTRQRSLSNAKQSEAKTVENSHSCTCIDLER